MKTKFQILIKREGRVDSLDLKCTQYQAKRVCDALAFASVEQDVFAIDLWLMGKTETNRLATWRVR